MGENGQEDALLERRADDLCTSLGELDRFLKRASQALHCTRCEMVALHAENMELKLHAARGTKPTACGMGTPRSPKLEVKPTLKPTVSGSSKDTDFAAEPPEPTQPSLAQAVDEAKDESSIQDVVSRSRELEDQGAEESKVQFEDHGHAEPGLGVEDEPMRIVSGQSSVLGPIEDADEHEEPVNHLNRPGLHYSPSTIRFTVDMFSKTRRRGKIVVALWEFLEEPESSRLAYYFSKFQDFLIQSSVLLSIIQTTPNPPMDRDTFGQVQISIDVFFMLELLVRFSTCPCFRAFTRSIYNINDLVAGALPLSLRAVRLFTEATLEEGAPKYLMFCVAPVLRELKLLRRVQQFHLFLTLLENIKDAVQVLMMLLMIVVLVFASMLYIVEPENNIGSMPKAMWLTVVTMTTVGYGDTTPDTVAGHLITSLLTLFSILYTAMPIGIIGNAFTQIWQDRDRILLMTKTRCHLLSSGYTAKDLPAIFRQYDGTGEGELDFEEFWLMVQDMNLGLNEQRAAEVFESIDRDGGGKLDEQEFVKAVFPSAYHELYGRSSGGGLGDDGAAEGDQEAQSISANVMHKVQDFWRQVSGESASSGGSGHSIPHRNKARNEFGESERQASSGSKRRKSVSSIKSRTSDTSSNVTSSNYSRSVENSSNNNGKKRRPSVLQRSPETHAQA